MEPSVRHQRNVEGIKHLLGKFELERNITILFAVESGSRMWGFPSTNSDYDVRFIYANDPQWYALRDFYLKGDQLGMDTITNFVINPVTDDELDFHGWDLQKAVKLVKGSNPSLHEWLQSPEKYFVNPGFETILKTVADGRWSAQAAFGNYMSMAHNNIRDYLRGDRVRYKKYLYVIRPILCANYVAENLRMPPMDFTTLVNHTLTKGPVKDAVFDLLRRKIAGEELDDCPTNPVLNEFIDNWMDQLIRLNKSMERAALWPQRNPETNDDLQNLIKCGFVQHMEERGIRLLGS